MGPSMQSTQITERCDEDTGHTRGHEISPNTKLTHPLHNSHSALSKPGWILPDPRFSTSLPQADQTPVKPHANPAQLT